MDFQSDVKVVLPHSGTFKSTLSLSPGGDIQLITGRNKLIVQLVRAILNEKTFSKGVANSKTSQTKQVRSLITSILRSFRNVQLEYVRRNDPDMLGFSVYRRAAGTTEDFVRISNKAITDLFIDENVFNDHTYTYGIAKLFKGMLESKFVDILDITPSASPYKLMVVSGSATSIISGDKKATIYVDGNRQFKKSELLQDILNISVVQSNVDPRKLSINIEIKNLLNEHISVSSLGSASAIGL